MATKTVCDHCGDEITDNTGFKFAYEFDYIPGKLNHLKLLDLCPSCKRGVLEAIEHPRIVRPASKRA